ncbi:TauD/TfdA family dioxygenase [Lysobacter enzymogenes]|uniref:TauD/TfdA family dioxygenase n=1 Tax=Lysobacter enzymogenes TaxID=69 RepID=UPI0008979A02|nr:TauD/TfdA family dioxygenase [Lysobacter enzymogenes]SDW73972.1 Taurine dioxygenase, alpha-ketoglutarate-dependent [Lysobacter enzymogenes]
MSVLSESPVLSTDIEPQFAPGKPVIVHAPALPDMDAARDWLDGRREALLALLREQGNFLLRGLPVSSAEDFAVVRDALIAHRAQYKEKATPRRGYGNDIYSSTEIPPMHVIRQHNENSYTLDFPGMLAFCCLQAPDSGGATPIADVRKVLSAVPPELAQRFRRHGWLLLRNYNSQVSLPWTTSFATTERAEVEAYCEQHLISATWNDDDSLTTRQYRPAVVAHPVTGEEVWFNHVAFWNSFSLDEELREVLVENYGPTGLPFETFLGDGSALSADEVAALNQAYDRYTCRESWQRGDVMVVDNILCSHGREAYTGQRRVVVAMGEPISMLDCPHSPPPRAA